MAEPLSRMSRRGYIGVGGGLVAAALAGCTGVLGASNSSQAVDGESHLRFEIAGDGPGEPVQATLRANGEELEGTVQPGEEQEGSPPDFEHPMDVSVDYGDDELAIEIEWDLPGVELELDLEQTVWQRTVVEVDFSLDNGKLTTDVGADLVLSNSASDLIASDTRAVTESDAYEVTVKVDVEADKAELEVELERDDEEDDDSEDEEHDEEDEEEEEDDDEDDEEDDDDDEDDEEADDD